MRQVTKGFPSGQWLSHVSRRKENPVGSFPTLFHSVPLIFQLTGAVEEALGFPLLLWQPMWSDSLGDVGFRETHSEMDCCRLQF